MDLRTWQQATSSRGRSGPERQQLKQAVMMVFLRPSSFTASAVAKVRQAARRQLTYNSKYQLPELVPARKAVPHREGRKHRHEPDSKGAFAAVDTATWFCQLWQIFRRPTRLKAASCRAEGRDLASSDLACTGSQ